MSEFRKKIFNALKNDNKNDNFLNYLSNVQNNLMKNYENPVFSNNDKNKLLQKYNDIELLGKSIYRYINLKQNNMKTEAEGEKEYASNLVLKGGISNCKYVWHSENSDSGFSVG